MAKLLEVVTFKWRMWDHRLPLFLLMAVFLITFLPQRCPLLPILSCCNQQTHCSQKFLLSERSYPFPFGLQYFLVDFSQGDMPISKHEMKEKICTCSFVYSLASNLDKPSKGLFLQMHLMGSIHHQQSISWTCSCASRWSFCLSKFWYEQWQLLFGHDNPMEVPWSSAAQASYH